LKDIVDLANTYDALVMVDECHGTGVLGAGGRGAVEHCGVMGHVDIITSTLGKAMGGATGGFTTGRKEIVEILRQKSRPYLFSNTLAPAVAAAGIEAFEILAESDALRTQLMENTRRFRHGMEELGFDIVPGTHPIVPVMLRNFDEDAKLAQDLARDLYDEGIYVIGFFFPVVPKGQSRIRVQISAAHSSEEIDRALAAFKKVGTSRGVLSK
jgi:glycine C-acetyltransferase